MIVMKFGGTSVGNAEAMKRVAGIISGKLEKSPLVIVSAVSKATDALVKIGRSSAAGDLGEAAGLVQWFIDRYGVIAEELELPEDNPFYSDLEETGMLLMNLLPQIEKSSGTESLKWQDLCLSRGEFLSTRLLTAYMVSKGIETEWVDAGDYMVTDSRYGKAMPIKELCLESVRDALVPRLKTGRALISQGFVGVDIEGTTTTLGRGGSDYSATYVGALIDAEAVEIWTDVDGILTADPSLLSEAKRIRWMTFEEAAELAYFGAKVLHPASIIPAIEKGIPVCVMNSLKPGQEGTYILGNMPEGLQSHVIAKSIAYKEGQAVLSIKSSRMLMAYGFLARIFQVFERFQTPVDLVSTSEVSVSVTIDNQEHLPEIMEELGKFAELEMRQRQAIVCVVGEGLCMEPGIPAKLFGELQGIRVNMISQGASSINISFVVDEDDLPAVISRIHKRFFEDGFDETFFA